MEMKRLIQWARSQLCSHEFFIDDITPRDTFGMVSCKCHKCQREFKASYGLALPGKWIGWRREWTVVKAAA